jgi:hypothetical protein
MLQNVKKALANPGPSTHGTSRHFAAMQQHVGDRSIADSGKRPADLWIHGPDGHRISSAPCRKA